MIFTFELTDEVMIKALDKAIIAATGNISVTPELDRHSHFQTLIENALDSYVTTYAVKILTKYQFLSRFTAAERVAIRAKAVDESFPFYQNLADFLDMLDKSGEIQLDNPDTIAGVNFLETLTLIPPGKAATILDPFYTPPV